MLCFRPLVLSTWKSSHNTLSVYRMYFRGHIRWYQCCVALSLGCLLWAVIMKRLLKSWLLTDSLPLTSSTPTWQMSQRCGVFHTCWTHFSPTNSIHMLIHWSVWVASSKQNHMTMILLKTKTKKGVLQISPLFRNISFWLNY